MLHTILLLTLLSRVLPTIVLRPLSPSPAMLTMLLEVSHISGHQHAPVALLAVALHNQLVIAS